MAWRLHLVYPVTVSRLGGPGLLTYSRSNDFELYRPARRAGLGPLTTTQEGVAILHDDSSILASPGQACGRTSPTTKTMNSKHPYDLLIPDLVIDAVDNIPTRLALAELCPAWLRTPLTWMVEPALDSLEKTTSLSSAYR